MATILTGPFATVMAFIPRVSITIMTTDNRSTPIMFKRRQLPVRPAFAMTINKSQEQTLENVGLYLPTPVFTPVGCTGGEGVKKNAQFCENRAPPVKPSQLV